MYPGHWQVMQLSNAIKAQCFWRKTIQVFTSGNFIEKTITDEYWGKVIIQLFES